MLCKIHKIYIKKILSFYNIMIFSQDAKILRLKKNKDFIFLVKPFLLIIILLHPMYEIKI